MSKLSIRDLQLQGKRVFIRVDFNVPLKNGVITDDTRIRSSLPTIQYALDQGALPIIASHFGRPKGTVNKDFTLAPIAVRLKELLGRDVAFATQRLSTQVASIQRWRSDWICSCGLLANGGETGQGYQVESFIQSKTQQPPR